MNTKFLDALSGNNSGPPPIWMMRQAGRALPEYRKLRQSHSLNELFHNRDLIVQITQMPIELLDVDAAILFSDILIPLETLGYELHYVDGSAPTVSLPQKEEHARFERLDFLRDAIERLRHELSVPLIGFAGGPYTLATYIEKDPSDALIEEFTSLTIDYVKLQIDAGVQAVQIFDSWAGLLPPDLFNRRVLPSLKKIAQALKETHIPLILFTRSSAQHLESLIAIEPQALSLDWQKPMREMRDEIPRHIAVQGNLDPSELLKPEREWRNTVERLLLSMSGEPNYIFNLGHGVLPTTPFDHLKTLVAQVKHHGI